MMQQENKVIFHTYLHLLVLPHDQFPFNRFASLVFSCNLKEETWSSQAAVAVSSVQRPFCEKSDLRLD